MKINVIFLIFIKKGLSNYLNGRGPSLSLDYTRAIQLPDYYDTDLGNFWTNPSEKSRLKRFINNLKILFYFILFLDNFMDYSSDYTSQTGMNVNKNIQTAKFQVIFLQLLAKFKIEVKNSSKI